MSSILGRVVKNGKTYGYLVSGVQGIVPKEQIYKYMLDNAKVCKDGRVYPLKGQFKEVQCKGKILYHGSKSGIVGNISPNYSSSLSDFGMGFYTGDKLPQAVNRVCNFKDSVLYKLSADLFNLRVYTFKDNVLWALYIGVNRHKINPSGYPKLVKWVNEVNSYDVIIGLIADDKMAECYNEFLNGNITDKCLVECLKLVQYGNQYVFKTQRACSKISIIDKRILSVEDRKRSLAEGKVLKTDIANNLARLKRQYRREGKYIDEVLEGYL